MGIPFDRKPLLEDSSVFCMLPWTHMSVAPDGVVTPCCVSNTAVDRLEDSTLAAAWDAPPMRRLRRDMLAGRENRACRACYAGEGNGAPSLRRWANRRFAHHYSQVTKTESDGRLGKLNMPFMDVRFSNICNFRCRTCSPEASSGWYQDARRLNEAVPRRTLRPTGDARKFWSQVEPLLSSVEEIRFQGGEPLLMKEHYQVLDALAERRKFDVVLRYNTNFSLMRFQGRDVMRLWDRFEAVHVIASLDASGARGEYLRKGQRWAQVIENRERMMRICPRAQFSISPTVSVMNVWHLPDFHREWVDLRYLGPNSIHLNPLVAPLDYNIRNLPEPFKRRIVEKYTDYIERRLQPDGREAEAHFRSILRFMSAESAAGQLTKFRDRTRRLDRIRNERCADVFPELREILLSGG